VSWSDCSVAALSDWLTTDGWSVYSRGMSLCGCGGGGGSVGGAARPVGC
jgi:hypothetical protein